MKRLLLFLLLMLTGVALTWPDKARAQGQVTVTATVLESISYNKIDGMTSVSTNYTSGYLIIAGLNTRYIVVTL